MPSITSLKGLSQWFCTKFIQVPWRPVEIGDRSMPEILCHNFISHRRTRSKGVIGVCSRLPAKSIISLEDHVEKVIGLCPIIPTNFVKFNRDLVQGVVRSMPETCPRNFDNRRGNKLKGVIRTILEISQAICVIPSCESVEKSDRFILDVWYNIIKSPSKTHSNCWSVCARDCVQFFLLFARERVQKMVRSVADISRKTFANPWRTRSVSISVVYTRDFLHNFYKSNENRLKWLMGLFSRFSKKYQSIPREHVQRCDGATRQIR